MSVQSSSPATTLVQDGRPDLACGIAFGERTEELVSLAVAEPFPSARHEPARPVQRVVLVPAVAERGLLSAPADVIDDGVGEVGSDRGAVPASRQVRFPGPSPEPDVQLPPHSALHEPVSQDYAASVVTAHGDGITAPR